MRNIFFIFIIISILVVINSCEYNPFGEYERIANENVTPPDIQVLDLNLDNSDTIFLYSGLEVAFRFASASQNIKNVKFAVDGIEKYNDKITDGQFYVDYGNIKEGDHTLLLEIVTATGSGSIADHLGAEGFNFSKSWVLFVDKSYYSKTTASSFNGRLKLSWPKCRSSDFREFIIGRYLSSGSAEIGRSVISEFIDSSYVGEGASYFVNAVTSDGKTIPWGHMNVSAELPVLSVYQSQDHQYSIKWGRYKYYNAVGSFNLRRSIPNLYSYTVVKSTSLYSDSTMFLPGVYFGDMVDFRLNIVPEKNNVMNIPDNYYMFERRLKTNAGIKFIDADTRLEEIFQVSSDEFVGLDNCYYLNRYSISKKSSVQRMTYQPSGCSGCQFRLVASSPGGKYLTSAHLCDGFTMMIPTDNLNNFTLHDLKSIQGAYYPVYMSEMGTALVNTSSDGFYVIDMKTSATLAHYKKYGLNSKGISISPGGDYILFSDDSIHLVKLTGSQFKKIWSDDVSKLPKFFGFDVTNPEQLTFWDGNVLSIRDCSSFSTINEFPLTESTLFNVDYYNQEFLTYKPGTPGHLYIRDYLNGRLLNDIPVNLDLTMWWYIKVYLFNHYVVCNNGFMDLFD